MVEDDLLSTKLSSSASASNELAELGILAPLHGLKVAWVGDSNNILADMLVAFPRLGINLSVAAPKGYERDEIVWGEMQDGLKQSTPWSKGQVEWTNDPRKAVQDADVVVTDTWISMGEEASKEQRLRDFAGFQVTEALCKGSAKPDWKFMHCLPRKSNEVDDEVFYGPRSIVFPEGENRRWTIQALVDRMFGKWQL
jgi:ornithine carbamoyltransferase